MLVIREETSRDVGQVRTINFAAFDQPDEAFVIPILQPAAVAGAAVVAHHRPDFDEVA